MRAQAASMADVGHLAQRERLRTYVTHLALLTHLAQNWCTWRYRARTEDELDLLRSGCPLNYVHMLTGAPPWLTTSGRTAVHTYATWHVRTRPRSCPRPGLTPPKVQRMHAKWAAPSAVRSARLEPLGRGAATNAPRSRGAGLGCPAPRTRTRTELHVRTYVRTHSPGAAEPIHECHAQNPFCFAAWGPHPVQRRLAVVAHL